MFDLKGGVALIPEIKAPLKGKCDKQLSLTGKWAIPVLKCHLPYHVRPNTVVLFIVVACIVIVHVQLLIQFK